MEKDTACQGKWARKPMVEWANWSRAKGQRVAVGTVEGTKPYTKRQFVHRCTFKLQLSEAQANRWRQDHLSNPLIKRTYTGFQGEMELHLSKGLPWMQENLRDVDSSNREGTRDVRNPSDRDRSALESQATNHRVNFGVSFL